DHFIDGDSGLSDQFDQRKQQLPVGLCELLDTGSRALLFVIDDMVRFLHGGGVLSKDCFWRIDSIEPAPPPPLNLQLRLGHPRTRLGARLLYGFNSTTEKTAYFALSVA